MGIRENIETVQNKIKAAAEKCGRNADEIKLVAVTKTYTIEAMNEAVACGVTDVGENKPQEIRDKYDKVPSVNWHLIGHLQTNKVKYVIDRCCMIHSVDSIKLMDEIERLAVKNGRDIDILIQVNISGEESKSGIAPDEIDVLLDYAQNLTKVHIKGLMTIVPKAENCDVRIHFKNMQQLFEDTKKKQYKNVSMSELSMGMSGDYETAIEYGATIVRVGSAIFGARNYDK